MSNGFTPIILVHLGAALASLAIGAAIFMQPKDTYTHRLLGHALWSSLGVI